ncbi:DNA polymerase delta small subunit Cdc1 [Teratosphaeriaceae sp. CCFEE 6253]|nr:DNA polymerase delta small subunit Cdc1 [Teratosphaeriaceae sp. CCFEE 6253]
MGTPKGLQNGSHGDSPLQPPSSTEHHVLTRTHATYIPIPTYQLPKGEHRHYQQQYADMYFARLAQLKPAVEAMATEAWADFTIAGETASRKDRVLDVRQGELCWVAGTVYMEMPLKPNVLEDIGKEHWIAAPPPRVKYDVGAAVGGDSERGAHAGGGKKAVGAQIMLEDESGRLRLTGGYLTGGLLVTGAIVAVVGTENADGDFEVLDLRIPDLPRQPARWESEDGDAALKGKATSQKREQGGKVAIVSGLGISGSEGDTLALDLLMEYLLGESADPTSQQQASTISRLIIAGNSLSHGSPIPSREELAAATKKGGRKTYGYDSSSYNAAPTDTLDQWLAQLLPSMPITLLPGASDPTSTALPQQPIHAAMFPHARAYMTPPSSTEGPGWFDSTTNPCEFSLSGHRFLGTGGQPVDDVYKYLPDCEERLEMMEAMLRWRLTAPTAPDTLPCYPFQDGDQFVLKECPHVFFVGNQPRFETKAVEGPEGQQVRVVAVPGFRESGEVVVMDLETLEVELVRFEVFDEG